MCLSLFTRLSNIYGNRSALNFFLVKSIDCSHSCFLSCEFYESETSRSICELINGNMCILDLSEFREDLAKLVAVNSPCKITNKKSVLHNRSSKLVLGV